MLKFLERLFFQLRDLYLGPHEEMLFRVFIRIGDRLFVVRLYYRAHKSLFLGSSLTQLLGMDFILLRVVPFRNAEIIFKLLYLSPKLLVLPL